jgi:thiol-disulfide isomerase/thioredoxin
VNRRGLLAGLAGATLPAVAGCRGSGNATAADGGGRVAVETVDAPGSEGGTVTVPAPEGLTFVEFFATTCSVCAAQMPALGEAYRRVGDGVRFLSVTSEPVGRTISRADLAAWWDEHGGTWPVGVDDGLRLTRRYDATAVPTALLLWPDGSVAWRHTGRVDPDRVVDAVRTATG